MTALVDSSTRLRCHEKRRLERARHVRRHRVGENVEDEQSLDIRHDLHPSSALVIQQQVWASAVDIQGPATAYSGAPTTLSLLLNCPSDGPSTAFIKAFDALSLAQLGVSYGDKNLTKQAAVAHLESVTSMRKELSKAMLTRTYTDELLAAPYLLFLVCMFEGIIGETKDAVAHLFGLVHMLQMLDDKRSPLACLLLDNCSHYLLSLGLFTRKGMPCYLTSSDEEILRNEIGDRCPELTRMTLAVPKLLEELEALDHDKTEEVAALLSKVSKAENRIRTWLHEQKARGLFTYREVPAHTQPTFISDLDELILSTFDVGYAFSSFGSALAHGRAWACLLAIVSIKLRLNKGYRGRDKKIVEDGDILADNLCKVVSFFIGTPSCGTHGWFTSAGSLLSLRRWYTAMCHDARLMWIAAVQDAIASKGLRLWTDLKAHEQSKPIAPRLRIDSLKPEVLPIHDLSEIDAPD